MKAVKPFKQYLTELAHLSDVLDQKGTDFVNSLLTQKLVVSIKVDSASLVVMNDNGKLRFFGRNGAQEIDLVKRVGFDFYERAIEHIESMPWQKLPSGVMFFMEMFSDILNPVIKYISRPRNNLIALFAKQNGRMLRPDDPILYRAAAILDISEPPIIFSGRLDQDQREQILDFISADPETRRRTFGGEDFKYMILSLFAVPKIYDYLIKQGLEGVVLYFGDNDTPISFKMVDPKFTMKIKEKMGDSLDYLKELYPVALKNAVGYASMLLLRNDYKQDPQGYIDFVGDLTRQIIQSQGEEILNTVGKYKNYVERSSYSGLNMKFAPASVLSISRKYFFVDDLFRTLLFSLQKANVRANPLKGISPEVQGILNKIGQILRSKGITES